MTCFRTYSFVYPLCMICYVSYFSICFQRLGFVSSDPQSASNSHILRAVLTRRAICRVSLFSQSVACLVMVDCACASLIFTSFNDFPSPVYVDPKYLNCFTSSSTFPLIHIYIGGWPWLYALDEEFAFVGADCHSVTISCFL